MYVCVCTYMYMCVCVCAHIINNVYVCVHVCVYVYFYFILFFCFLGPHQRHMEVPRLGVGSAMQLLAYLTATATQDPSRVFDLHPHPRQCRILNPLSEAMDYESPTVERTLQAFGPELPLEAERLLLSLP